MRTVHARARKSVYMRYINIYVEEVLPRVELPFADYQLRGNEHVGIPVDTGVPPAVQIRFYRILFRIPREGERGKIGRVSITRIHVCYSKSTKSCNYYFV